MSIPDFAVVTDETAPRRGRTERFDARLAETGAFLSAKAVVERFDEESLRVRTERAVAVGRVVSVRFKLPRAMSTAYEGMRCSFPARVVESRQVASGGMRRELTLKWEEPLTKLVRDSSIARFRLIGGLSFLALAVIVWTRWEDLRFFWYSPLLQIYSATLGIYFFSRFFLVLFHRTPKPTGYEPTVSVVISVRNEKNAIVGAITSSLSADYPAEKREVIVVDDGSNDGTGQVIDEVQRRLPDLKVFHIPASGKRTAMATGIRAAKGDIVVVVDSDTVLDRMALRHIVCGFEDPSLGASAGYTAVANAEKNLLTRMQDLRYLVSYELMKAPESVFSCVSCCPGCLSAYRREYLLKILDAWLAQTFMGARATFGDDRSLTNFILRDYRVIYNPHARSTTLVPETWMRYMRQQCRWKKSWLREAPIVGKILLKKHPVAAISFYASSFCSLFSPMMAVYYLCQKNYSLFFAYLIGLGYLGLLISMFAVWRRPTKHWWISWYWIASQVLLMGPQTYYALVTMRKNHWGTR